jgi:hypothetical protein
MFQDEERFLGVMDARWRFSHDRMRFFGYNTRTGVSAGWLGLDGPGGEEPFPEMVAGDGWLIHSRHREYQVQSHSGEVDVRLELPAGERRLTEGSLEQEQRSVVASDRAVYLFEGRGYRGPHHRIPLPGAVENLEGGSVLRLANGGALVTFLQGRLSERGAYPARMVILEVADSGAAGAVTPVVDRPLVAGAPAWVRHRGFIASPLLQGLQDLAWRDPEAPRWSQIPASVWLLALGLSAVAALWTAGLARRRRFSPPDLVLWTALAFLGGLPGFLSFFLLGTRRGS